MDNNDPSAWIEFYQNILDKIFNDVLRLIARAFLSTKDPRVERAYLMFEHNASFGWREAWQVDFELDNDIKQQIRSLCLLRPDIPVGVLESVYDRSFDADVFSDTANARQLRKMLVLNLKASEDMIMKYLGLNPDTLEERLDAIDESKMFYLYRSRLRVFDIDRLIHLLKRIFLPQWFFRLVNKYLNYITDRHSNSRNDIDNFSRAFASHPFLPQDIRFDLIRNDRLPFAMEDLSLYLDRDMIIQNLGKWTGEGVWRRIFSQGICLSTIDPLIEEFFLQIINGFQREDMDSSISHITDIDIGGISNWMLKTCDPKAAHRVINTMLVNEWLDVDRVCFSVAHNLRLSNGLRVKGAIIAHMLNSVKVATGDKIPVIPKDFRIVD